MLLWSIRYSAELILTISVQTVMTHHNTTTKMISVFYQPALMKLLMKTLKLRDKASDIVVVSDVRRDVMSPIKYHMQLRCTYAHAHNMHHKA